jgi:uncharacterized phiE125 gp8 family phage protein
MLKYKVVTPSASEVLTLNEVKAHLQIDPSFTADDAMLNAMITAVRQAAQEYLGRFLLTTVVDQFYHSWGQGLLLFFTPVIGSATVTYFNTEGNQQTLAASEYELDTTSEPSRIWPAFNKQWPALRPHPNSVVVRYSCGYASAAAVPGPIKQAMLIMITAMYEHRDETVKRMPTSSEYLLRNYRIKWLW